MNAERISMKCGGDYHYHGTTNSWTYYILSEIGQGCRIWQKIRIDVKPMLPRSEWAHTFHRLATQTSLSKQVLSTEAAFSACSAWHWPDLINDAMTSGVDVFTYVCGEKADTPEGNRKQRCHHSCLVWHVIITTGQSNLRKSASRGPIPRLGVTPGGRKLYHWIPGVGFPISVL